MKCIHALLAALAILALGITPIANADTAGQPFDLQGFITTAVNSGKKEIRIPAGRYRVTPKRGVHLSLRDLKNVTIDARNVEMICTQTTLALEIQHCQNLTIRGLTIDYDPLPFTQGRITAVAPDHSWLEFQVADGYPDQKPVVRIEIFDGQTQLLKTPTDFGWQPFVSLGNHRYRALRRAGYRHNPAVDTEAVGDILVTNNSYAPDGEAAHAVVSTDCTGLRLDHVTVYASNCFGFLENGCDGTVYQSCVIDRCPPERDLVKRALPRLRSLDADAYHSVNAVRGPAILQCTAKFQGDDCVNIHGQYFMIMEVKGTTLRVLASGKVNISPNDPVELLSYDGRRLPDAVATAIVPDGAITPAEREFLSHQEMDAGIRSQGLKDAYRITLNRAVPAARGSLICSSKRIGNGFRVEGCDFGFNRSRGVLIKASNGTVLDNTIVGTWGPAVLVCPEFWWLEAGSSKNVQIRNNTIRDCRDVGINVYATGGSGDVAPAGAHAQITVAGNTIRNTFAPNICITSTTGLVLKDNRCTDPATGRPNSLPRNPAFAKPNLPLVMTLNCSIASSATPELPH